MPGPVSVIATTQVPGGDGVMQTLTTPSRGV